jgi:putative SOS response-associated peptidase YedK
MCNLYRMTSSADAIAQLFAPLDTGGANVPPLHEIFPDYAAPVIVAGEERRRLVSMQWGGPAFGQVKRPVTNIRNLASPMWRSALADPARRCVVPVTAFSEWSAQTDPLTGRKRKHWFALRNAQLFGFAGLWRPTPGGPRFAFLTCAANELVGRVHPKAMPVILDTPDEASRWLRVGGDEAAAMQCPLAHEAMHEIEVADIPPPQGSLL